MPPNPADTSSPAASARSRAGANPGMPGANGTAKSDASLVDLFGGLVSDAQALVHKEVELVKREVAIEFGKARSGAVLVAAGAGVLAMAAILLLVMLVRVLADVVGLPLWLSYLIVGGVVAIAGVVVLNSGISQLKQVSPVPNETIETIQEDVEWIKERNQSSKI